VTFRVEGFVAEAFLAAGFRAGAFFLLGARFVLTDFFVDAGFFFAFVFFLLPGRFAVFFFDAAVFLLEPFLVDGLLAEPCRPTFFEDVFLRAAAFTVDFLPLVFFLAAAFLLGIELASKDGSENGRLYIPNGPAEASCCRRSPEERLLLA